MDTPQLQLSGAEEDTQTKFLENAQNSQNPDSLGKPQNTEDQAQGQDVEMDDTQDATEKNGQVNTVQDENATDAQPAEPSTPAKKDAGFGFLKKTTQLTPRSYLTSPIVEIVVGQGENETILTAHQTLLLESPFLEEAVTKFDESGPRRIHLAGENVDAFGCFLQFQYTRDYASKPSESSNQPKQDAEEVDDSGEQLLKHARVYTLAEKLGIPALKILAHNKIHRVNSSPRGELEYARYVYTHTTTEDGTLRKPVASFWSKTPQRHGVEEEFKKLCLEAPEFCYDVLALVLKTKEKRGQEKTEPESGTRTGRKRQRVVSKQIC